MSSTELREAVARPVDLVDCMACYLAVPAGNRSNKATEPTFADFQEEAVAMLASLGETVPGFTPRSRRVSRAIAAARGKC